MLHPFYIIRHAQSLANLAELQALASGLDFKLTKHMWDLTLVDPTLSPKGRTQIIQSRPKAHLLNVRKVLVSPLKRTLETCRGLFEDHPLQPEVHVCPWMSEQLGTISELSSLANGVNKDFETWNWQLFEGLPRDYWQFGVITTEKFQILRNSYKDFESFAKLVATKIEELYPDCLENPEETTYRCKQLRALLLDELKQGPVALVGHQSYFKQFTHRETGKSIILDNCEISQQQLSTSESP